MEKTEYLRIENLTVEVEDKVILDNLNLTINSGEMHVLLGSNGARKIYTI